MIKVGIIGAAGYTAGELIRLLVNHPEVEITFAHSTSNAGQPFHAVHTGLIGDTEQCFSDTYDLHAIDVLFLCSGHGKSTAFWAENECPDTLKIIDLAQDYRDEHDGYVYGLPELQREKICACTKLANPGCFATAIQLALLPMIGRTTEASVTAITGSTGAGQKPTATTHFSWRNDNMSVYKAFTHQHLLEIGRNTGMEVEFIPMRGDFSRGIIAAVTMPFDGTAEEAYQLYSQYYKDAAFTHVINREVNLKDVVNTNKCVLQTQVHEGRLLVTSVIDNLLKGASGQALQNMNLMFGLDETTGLRLKALAF
jgi:N-acetyl-gamma-glutamyl-phosphate reductase